MAKNHELGLCRGYRSNIHSVSFLNVNLWPWIGWVPRGLSCVETVPILNDEDGACGLGQGSGVLS